MSAKHKKRIFKSRSNNARKAKKLLNDFLNANNKKLAVFLARIWNDQQKAITYKELREAILQGYLTEEQFYAWQSDYANFLNKYLKEFLRKAAASGMESIHQLYLSGLDVYDPMTSSIENWIVEHGAEWITNMSNQTRETVNTLIQYSTKGNLSVDELSRIIRPTIGLTTPQSVANAKYYETVKANLLKNNPTMGSATVEKKAREAAAKYAARQHRERAQMIAETELAFAYNKGADDAIKQAQDEGLLPEMNSVWTSAGDDGVCEICAELDGQVIAYGDSFSFPGKSLYAGQKRTPPAHPRCRCVLCYEET